MTSWQQGHDDMSPEDGAIHDQIARAFVKNDEAKLMTAHTPGPWYLIWHGNEKYPYPLSVDSGDGSYWIARDGQVSSKANARLIAAAPALFAELGRICQRFHDRIHTDEEHLEISLAGRQINAIRAAIASATESGAKS